MKPELDEILQVVTGHLNDGTIKMGCRNSQKISGSIYVICIKE